MQNRLKPIETLLGAILLFYLVPMVILSVYGMGFGTSNRSWGILSLGLLFASAGSLALYLLLRRWEEAMKSIPLEEPEEISESLEVPLEPVADPLSPSSLEISQNKMQEEIEALRHSLDEHQNKYTQLLEEQNGREQALQKLQVEKEGIQQQSEAILQEFISYKDTSQEQLQHKDILLGEYQQTITEQRALIEKKQEQLAELQSKIEDLNYEIRTLIEVVDTQPMLPIMEAELENPISGTVAHGKAEHYQAELSSMMDEETLPLESLVHSPEEAAIQLKRCLDIAQKMTGAGHMGGAASFLREMPYGNDALDLRRLFDSLRSESASPVLVYSQKENKLLFVNSQTRNLLGWSPEKVVQNFSDIVKDGIEEWKNGINQLYSKPESHVRLVMKTKMGHDLLVHCQLASVPSGLFRNHIIGVMYPVA